MSALATGKPAAILALPHRRSERARWRAVVWGMTQHEVMALACGIGLILLYGVLHVFGLELIRRAKPKQDNHRYMGLLFTFWGLAPPSSSPACRMAKRSTMSRLLVAGAAKEAVKKPPPSGADTEP